MKSTYGYVTDGSFSHNLPFYSRIWFRPLGVHLGLRPSRAHRRAHENPYLEKVPKCRCFLADCLLYVKISQNKCQEAFRSDSFRTGHQSGVDVLVGGPVLVGPRLAALQQLQRERNPAHALSKWIQGL